MDEGRYADAERLTRIALDINHTLGVADDASSNAQLLSQLGSILNLQSKYKDASAVYASLDSAIARWEPRRREMFELTAPRIASLYQSGQTERGIAAAELMVKRTTERVGRRAQRGGAPGGLRAPPRLVAERGDLRGERPAVSGPDRSWPRSSSTTSSAKGRRC